MRWRPKNWEDDKFYACMDLTEGGGSYANIYDVFEAGADAMLGAIPALLIKLGWVRTAIDLRLFTYTPDEEPKCNTSN